MSTDGKLLPTKDEVWACSEVYNLFSICRSVRYQSTSYWRTGKLTDCYPYLDEFKECMKMKLASKESNIAAKQAYHAKKNAEVQAVRPRVWTLRQPGEELPDLWASQTSK
eukprot:CFRG1462T1